MRFDFATCGPPGRSSAMTLEYEGGGLDEIGS